MINETFEYIFKREHPNYAEYKETFKQAENFKKNRTEF